MNSQGLIRQGEKTWNDLEIEGSLAEAHASMALIKEMSWNFSEAEKEFRKALELNPNYPTALHWYSLFMRYQGRPDDALPLIKRAQELDPLSLIISANVIEAYLAVGDTNSAFEQAKKLLELDPNNWGPHHRMALCYLKQENLPAALSEFKTALELSKRSTFSLAYYGYALALSAEHQEPVAIIKELEERFAKRQSGGRDIATVYPASATMTEPSHGWRGIFRPGVRL